jgi:hypothetical protein
VPTIKDLPTDLCYAHDDKDSYNGLGSLRYFAPFGLACKEYGSEGRILEPEKFTFDTDAKAKSR